MARQTINLDFKANISQAKDSVVSLAQAYRQALEGGDSGQKAQINEALKERSAAMGPGGFDVDQIAKVLEDVIGLQSQYEESTARLEELKKSTLRVDEEIREINREKNNLLEEASKILGKDDTIKITELRKEFALIQKNNEELEKKGQLTEEDKRKAEELFRILENYNKVLGEQKNKNKEAKDINEKTLETDKKRKALVDAIRTALESLSTNEDERSAVTGEILEMLLETENSYKRTTAEAKKLKKESENIKKEQKEVAETIASAKDSFAGKAVQAFVYYQALTALRRVARAAVSTLRELDKALTDIAVVTAMSRKESWQLLGTFQEMSKVVGLTTTEVANLSIAFFRQGRSARDALQLTETAAKFAKIAAIDVNDAANFLTAAINGFNLAATEAERIIDRFAALGAGAAASASEIAIALSKVAPAAASAGVEIDNLMAFVTKGIETTREAPENIGTAFKTIFARMRELTDIGRVMEDGMDVNRVETALASVGVALRDANGQFRNLDQVLIEVGKKWDTIDRNSQAYLATTLAGTRQQTRLIALFEDFDRTLELIELSQDSAGVATIQHTEFMRGMEAATKRLQTSFQELITSFANSEQIIFIINSLNTAFELMNTVVGRSLIVLTMLGTTFLMATNPASKLGGVIRGMTAFIQKKALYSWGALGASLKARIIETDLYKNKLAGLTVVQKTNELMNNLQSASQWAGGAAASAKTAATDLLNKAIGKNTLTNIKNSLSTNVLTKGIWGANVALFKFIALMLKTPLGLFVLVSGLVIGIKKIMDATDTTNETVAGLQVTFKKIGLTIKNLIDWIKKAIKAVWDFLKPLQGILKVAIAIAFPLVGVGIAIAEIWKATRSPLDKAVASFTVLQNRIGKLNEEVRNLESESRKLNKTVSEFQQLSRLRFLSPEEAKRLEELQTQLQLDLGTSFTGDQLLELAQKELDRVSGELTRATAERAREINSFFQKNPLANFADLRTTDLLSDEAKANLDVVATQYATSLIDGFDEMAPEVQEAIRRMIQGNVEEVIDSTELDGIERAIESGELTFGLMGGRGKIVVEEGESAAEAYARAVEEGLIRTSGLFAVGFDEFERNFNRRLETAQSAILTGPIADFGADIAKAYGTISTEGFGKGVGSIQSILSQIADPEELERTLSQLEAAFPSIRDLVQLTETQIKGLADSGGMKAFREFRPFQDLAQNLFTDAAGVFDEDSANEFLDNIFNQLIAVDPAGRAEAGAELMRQVLSGAMDIPPDARTQVANAIQDTLLGSTENLTARAFQNAGQVDRLADIMGKGIEATPEDIQFITERWPGAVAQILNGTADINALQEEYNSDVLEALDTQEERLWAIMQTKQEQGVLTDMEAEALGAQIQQIQIAREYLTLSREATEDIKARFEAQRESLKAQRQAIDDAKKLRDLEQRAVEASALSTQAVRIGAVGTIEARFNQQQLNKQIEQMNRDLEERIQIAKIEAQDRILEETQRKQLVEAQNKNTIALNTLTEVIRRVRPNYGVDPTTPTGGVGVDGGGGNPGDLPAFAPY